MKWLKKDSAIKISVMITVIMAILVSMNLVELMNRYVISSYEMVRNSEYEYQELWELHHYKESLYANGATDNDAHAKRMAELLEDVRDFMDNLPEFSGNITVPLVYMRLNEGMDICVNVVLSFNEELPYEIEKVSDYTDGVYIGNSYNGYWEDGELLLNSVTHKVAGIIKSSTLRMDNTVVIPYAGMNETARENLLIQLATYLLYDREFPVYFSSASGSSVESDTEIMKKYIGEKGIFSLAAADNSVEEDIEYEKDDTIVFYRVVKNMVSVMAGIFCFISVFEALRLFLNRKKRDIAIMWSFGSKKTEIYKMLIRELGVAVFIGIVLAFVLQWLIYVVILGCRVYTTFAYGMYALAAVLVISLLMMFLITQKLIRKEKINEERNG